jgi:hypothetical protein
MLFLYIDSKNERKIDDLEMDGIVLEEREIELPTNKLETGKKITETEWNSLQNLIKNTIPAGYLFDRLILRIYDMATGRIRHSRLNFNQYNLVLGSRFDNVGRVPIVLVRMMYRAKKPTSKLDALLNDLLVRLEDVTVGPRLDPSGP